MSGSLELEVASVQAALADPGQLIGCGPGGRPRYELFHAAGSICSHKVRAVLAFHDLAYRSHTLNLFAGQTYLPAYVRLRMAGCDRLGTGLAARHDGSTSTSRGGCDGAVVPTLVDWEAGAVIVDSKLICLHLDSGIDAARRLRPERFGSLIDKELEIVDNLPNYQMLMARPSAPAGVELTKGSLGGAFSERKVAWCDAWLRDHADDELLVRAYTAKRAKEASAAQFLFSDVALDAARAGADAALRALEDRLARSPGPWLLGESFTMADLFWGIELIRMKGVGASASWEKGRLPRVENLLAAAEAVPAIRAAVIHWPGALL
jgi:2,5-dichlorohydroquinone reductive dechlorinase